MGTVFAHSRKAYHKWRRAFDRTSKHRAPEMLTGAALEAAVARVGQMFPGHVVREVRPGALGPQQGGAA